MSNNHSYKKHGLSRTYYEVVRHSMMDRCYNWKNKRYKHYGGRGIVVCCRWRKSLAMFARDMGPRPSRKHSIDRVDNNGNYEPNNCRWATAQEQSYNMSRNVLIIYLNRVQCATAWAREYGLRPRTLLDRLARGWTTEKAITTPAAKRSNKKGTNHAG